MSFYRNFVTENVECDQVLSVLTVQITVGKHLCQNGFHLVIQQQVTLFTSYP
jgi:hypothetical protein